MPFASGICPSNTLRWQVQHTVFSTTHLKHIFWGANVKVCSVCLSMFSREAAGIVGYGPTKHLGYIYIYIYCTTFVHTYVCVFVWCLKVITRHLSTCNFSFYVNIKIFPLLVKFSASYPAHFQTGGAFLGRGKVKPLSVFGTRNSW